MKFIILPRNLECKEYLAKINNLPNHHGARSPEARGPMQPHRLKAGPVHSSCENELLAISSLLQVESVNIYLFVFVITSCNTSVLRKNGRFSVLLTIVKWNWV